MSANNANSMIVNNMVFDPIRDERVKGNQPTIALDITFTNAKTLASKSGGADKALQDVGKEKSIPIISVEVGSSRGSSIGVR
jgi:hypothetical protein